MTKFRVFFYKTDHTSVDVEADDWEDAITAGYDKVGDWEFDSVEEVEDE